jgi:hypothetical protein
MAAALNACGSSQEGVERMPGFAPLTPEAVITDFERGTGLRLVTTSDLRTSLGVVRLGVERLIESGRRRLYA